MTMWIPDEIDFAAYLKETDHSHKVKQANVFVESAKELLENKRHERKVYLPWTKTRDNFEFRAGEVTVWAGQNGHGKTDVTTQIALSLVGQGQKVCIASFEMKPVTTISRMVRMYAMTNPFSHEYQSREGIDSLKTLYDEFGEWSTDKLWLYDQTGTAETETVLGMIKYCGKELGITDVFVDSLMKCVKGEDDFNGQKSFVDELCALAKDMNMHIHLVHHLKKPPKETDIPDKHDTKGSGSITDQVDNLFMVWRNKAKEDEMRMNPKEKKKQNEPDCYLLCKKQRNYFGQADGEPTIGLWRHRDAGNFVEADGAQPCYFPNFPHEPTR